MKQQIEEYFDRLWPICRSLSGNGNRESLRILAELVDLEITEVPSGTLCFDWTVPPEWNIREAWIRDSRGQKLVDFAVCNLHILGYSEPFSGKLSFEELRPHLYSLPEQPDLIPYITSYYSRRWGFCLSHWQLLQFDPDEVYEVFIDSDLNENGSMTTAQALLKGSSEDEILISTYICHPSLASNELSGPLVAAALYQELKKIPDRRYTYRFLFVPETIGTIYALSVLGPYWKEKMVAGFVVTCVGDDGQFTYKKSRRGNSLTDRASEIMLRQSDENFILHEFFPRGSDERQYCSPGFNLPVGSLMRTMYGEYPEYHTSADNKDYISFEAMEQTVNKFLDIIHLMERNDCYINTMPFCEPQLGKRGLYPTLGNSKTSNDFIEAVRWILNLSDGENDLIRISEKSGMPVKDLLQPLEKLLESGLLRRP